MKKKLVSIVLALVMVFSLATVALAAEVTAPKYDVLQGVVNLAAKYYQEKVCKHEIFFENEKGEVATKTSFVCKGYTAWDEEEHTHTMKYLCPLCGKVEYVEESCVDHFVITGFTGSGKWAYFKCDVCGQTWQEPAKHEHYTIDVYEPVKDSIIPMHCKVTKCIYPGCNYEVVGEPELCLFHLEDDEVEGYAYNVHCEVCDRSFLAIPTAEKVVADVTEAVKEHALEMAKDVLAKQIETVLTNAYNSLTPEQQATMDNLWNAIKFVADLWTEKEGFNADNEWWS